MYPFSFFFKYILSLFCRYKKGLNCSWKFSFSRSRPVSVPVSIPTPGYKYPGQLFKLTDCNLQEAKARDMLKATRKQRLTHNETKIFWFNFD